MQLTDLCDRFRAEIQVVTPLFRSFGGHGSFHGRIETVKVFEDNVLVREALEEPGQGRVLVVDGGGSLRCALLGDRMAQLASENGWAGVVIYGCVRDTVEMGRIEVGVKALQPHPFKSGKKGEGERGVTVRFGDVTFEPGHHLYADEDGIIVAPRNLLS